MLVYVKNTQVGLTCQASWVAGFGCHADTGTEPPPGNAILGQNVLQNWPVYSCWIISLNRGQIYYYYCETSHWVGFSTFWRWPLLSPELEGSSGSSSASISDLACCRPGSGSLAGNRQSLACRPRRLGSRGASPLGPPREQAKCASQTCIIGRSPGGWQWHQALGWQKACFGAGNLGRGEGGRFRS